MGWLSGLGAGAGSTRRHAHPCMHAFTNDEVHACGATCAAQVETEGMAFEEELLSDKDPSILYFMVASGDDITSKQLRDDLMTMLIAGHETTAAVLTWTLHLLAQHPEEAAKVRAEVDAVLGDRKPDMEDLKALR